LSLDERAALPVPRDNAGIEYLRLNRQDICETEISSAVRLFLIDEDAISTHLLASAASEIMGALLKGQAGVGLNDTRIYERRRGLKALFRKSCLPARSTPTISLNTRIVGFQLRERLLSRLRGDGSLQRDPQL
jgi:hypothetical protein